MATQVFRIPAQNMQILQDRLAELNRKSRKLRLAPITMTEISSERIETARHTYSIFYSVEICGETPMYDGWELAAILQDGSDEQGVRFNVLRQVPGVATDAELIPFRHREKWCDYCRKNRQRNDTYLLRHFEGVIQQVGSNCLKDFLGHTDPMSLARQAEYILDVMELASSLEEDETGPGHGAGYRPVIDTETYLAWVAASIEARGWWSRRKVEESDEEQMTTASNATWAMDQVRQYPNNTSLLRPTDAHYARAQAALTWIRAMDESTIREQYTANLYAACRGMVVDVRQKGIVASLYTQYDRAMNVQRERADAPVSQFQGTVGSRATFKKLTVTRETPYQGGYGMSYAYALIDERGNQFSWFSSKPLLSVSETYDLFGTIKAHDDSWKGIKKTVLTRCKITKTYTKVAV